MLRTDLARAALLASALALVPVAAGCQSPGSSRLEGEDEEIGSLSQRVSCGGKTPATPASYKKPVEALAKYVGQSTCDPTAKPALTAFRDLVLALYPCTGDFGISRACNVGGKSEHKEGRAWDWKVAPDNAAAADLLSWLTATDSQGNRHAMARRLGIMYIVWNRQTWKAYKASAGWTAYTGSSPHTDHVHFSFSWDGANKKTSFWTGSGTLPLDAGVPPKPDVFVPPSPDAAVRVDRGAETTDANTTPGDFGRSDRGTFPRPDVPLSSSSQNTGSLVGGCGVGGAPSHTSAVLLALLALLALWPRRRSKDVIETDVSADRIGVR